MMFAKTIATVIAIFAGIGLFVSEISFYRTPFMQNPLEATQYAQNAGNSGVVLMFCLAFLAITSKKLN